MGAGRIHAGSLSAESRSGGQGGRCGGIAGGRGDALAGLVSAAILLTKHHAGPDMRGRSWYMGAFTATVASFAIHGLPLAASFDCTHAASPREQLICRDPVLSDLDGRLGRAYQARRAVLSPHGAELLQSSERSWLHFITTVCPLAVPADADERRIPKNCLQEYYEERLNQLAKVGQRVGPFLFNRIDLYAAEPAPAEDQTGGTPGFYVQHVAYPQIDNPHSPQEEAWNKQMVKSLAGEEEPADYEIGYANRRVISMQWRYDESGSFHPWSWFKAENIVLLPNPRALTAQDVFGPGNRWVVKLQKLLWPENEEGVDNDQIRNSVIQPDAWLFTTTGVKVSVIRGRTRLYMQ
jgi:uncharacterized protein